jgi:acetyl-CoA C-acetyltransferase
MGGFQGDLSALSASAMGSAAIRAALDNAKLAKGDVEEVIMGCVLAAGQGQAPARQAALGADLPLGVACTTVNKMCGSGMKAMMMASDALLAGSADVIVAGGMESMSNAPYLLPNARGGMRLGHGEVKDHMFLDGLEDAYGKGKPMGVFAEATASKYQFSREAQDAYALKSLSRAQTAIADGSFDDEVSAITVKTRKSENIVTHDEQPGKAMPEKIPNLRPAFVKDGTVTAANSSSISDGAAALVMMRRSTAEEKGLKPIAVIQGSASNAHEPAWFTTAPIGAMEKVMAKVGWTKDDVDLFEINEAFAVVPMAAMQEMGLDHAKVNVHGGACALGHPIGASGARISVTLISALKKYGKKKGIASLCIGGGEATAIAIELV